MRLCVPVLVTVSLSTWSAATRDRELVVRVTDPSFTVTIPGQPQVQLGPHPSASQNPSARLNQRWLQRLGTHTEGERCNHSAVRALAGRRHDLPLRARFGISPVLPSGGQRVGPASSIQG